MGSAPEAARDFLLPLPGIPTACGNGKWEVSQDLSELRSGRKMRTTGRPALAFHPFVRSAPSFRPDLRAARAGARSGGQGWPVFGPPRQRRAASLTAASTTACSIVSGLRSLHATNKPSKGVRERPSKKELMLNRNAAHPVNAMLNYGYSALQDLVCKTGGRSCSALIPYFSSAQRKAEATLFPKSKPEAGFSAASRKTSTAGPWARS